MPSNLNKPKSFPSLDPDFHDHVRRVTLEEQYGTPAEQKDKLVVWILATFQDPSKWPFTDAERILFMRRTYDTALMIQRTEASGKQPAGA